MTITLNIDKHDAKRLRELAKKFPRETFRGIGRSAAIVRARLRKVMKEGGGVHGVPAFIDHDSATRQIQTARGAVDNRIGGRLADPTSIQMFRRREMFTVGFISGLEGYARSIQEPETRALTRGERLFFLRNGVDQRTYDRRARPILEPFAREQRDNLLKWAIRNTEKILEKAGKG